MDYFKKYEENPYSDLVWNIPEQKQGIVNIIGGNSQNFRNTIRISEFLDTNYAIKTLNIVLPDSLKDTVPNLPNFIFLRSTESGSFGEESEVKNILNSGDHNLIIGDLSKNRITGKAFSGAYESSEKPLLITRDAIDLLIENYPEKVLLNENVTLFITMQQLQKLLRAIYYPKMLLLSQSLVQVAEVLHKVTLSYPISITTLHEGLVLVSKNGEVVTMPLEKTTYSPITFWMGEAASKTLIFNLFNPHNFIPATISGLFS